MMTSKLNVLAIEKLYSYTYILVILDLHVYTYLLLYTRMANVVI